VGEVLVGNELIAYSDLSHEIRTLPRSSVMGGKSQSKEDGSVIGLRGMEICQVM